MQWCNGAIGAIVKVCNECDTFTFLQGYHIFLLQTRLFGLESDATAQYTTQKQKPCKRHNKFMNSMYEMGSMVPLDLLSCIIIESKVSCPTQLVIGCQIVAFCLE